MSCSTKIISKNFIPIRYEGYLNLDVLVADKYKGNFIFDTGCNGIVLDSLFCKESGYKDITTDLKIGGIGNSKKILKVITDSIHYKYINTDYYLDSNIAIMLDLKSMVGRQVDGIFGLETFSDTPYMIDYVSQKITFTNSIKGYEVVNSHFEAGRIYIDLSLTLNNGNSIYGKFLVDTGSDQTIFNNHVFMTEGIYNSLNKKKFYSKGGIGGDSNGYFLPVSSINIGKFKIENFITTISTDTLGMLANSNYMGIIGNDLLDDFNIIFDHRKEKIWVTPNKNFNKNIKKLFRGISFFDTGEKWYVARVVEDSEAYRKGIRMNDEILQINNVPVENIDIDMFSNKLKANDVLRLKIKRGEEEKDIEFRLNVFLKS
jgi:predicted aspartyl protease